MHESDQNTPTQTGDDSPKFEEQEEDPGIEFPGDDEEDEENDARATMKKMKKTTPGEDDEDEESVAAP